MTRHAARTDANHADIRNALRQIGCYVIDCSAVGHGFPDLLVAWRGKWTLLEIKDGSKVASARKLTADQQIFHAEAVAKGCCVYVVESEGEAIRAMQHATLGKFV